MGSKLFVGNLPYQTTSEDLQALFAEIGTCESATVVSDRETGRSRGFGFVEMGSPDEAQRAIENLNGRDMGGREIKVDMANERPPRDGRGGDGGRRY